MLGIAKYFTTRKNTVDGMKKHLVFMPPAEGQTEGYQSVNNKHITLRELDDIADNFIDNCLDASEISITFKEEFRNKYTDYEIKKVLTEYLSIHRIQVILYPEYGDNTHLHYHGVVRGRKIVLSELLKALKKYFGRTTLRMIKNPARYKEYIRKERVSVYPDITKLTIFKLNSS